ncbi:MAG: alanine:cation symporter family protein, partial [Clostridia bacterium]|nr:alanine:cation symporter family protein [Clostridia bacterium]
MGTVILLSCVGAWFLLRLRGGIFLHPRASLRTYVDGTRASGGHPLRTLMLALAGTLGVGNITGVVLAVRTGGAGTVFWLVLSSVFGATLKYAESVITLTSRGNPHYLGIPRLLSERRLPAPRAPAYAVLTRALAVFMGWMLQSSAVAGAARPLGVSPAVAVAVLLILLVPAALCGVSRIERITEFV